jgi:hypothetical protein
VYVRVRECVCASARLRACMGALYVYVCLHEHKCICINIFTKEHEKNRSGEEIYWKSAILFFHLARIFCQ